VETEAPSYRNPGAEARESREGHLETRFYEDERISDEGDQRGTTQQVPRARRQAAGTGRRPSGQQQRGSNR
jgi:hypothetical protein